MKYFKPLLKITVCLSLVFCMKSAFIKTNDVAKAEIGGYLGSVAAPSDCIPCQVVGGFTGGEAGGAVGASAGQWIGGAIGSLGGPAGAVFGVWAGGILGGIAGAA